MSRKKKICQVAIIILALVLLAEGSLEQTSGDTDANATILLYTSDIHCGFDQGFTILGISLLKNILEQRGHTVFLLDAGDAIQGEYIGELGNGEIAVCLMNMGGYDIATLGNHEFDYGTESFIDVSKQAQYEYICANFEKNYAPVFRTYVLKTGGGVD